MIKIYDCSNSSERPANRGNGGPIENDIIRYLKQYCSKYNCMFVESPNDANVIITNDVFPENILMEYNHLPRIKRMDGVFFQKQYIERNEPLNRAAQLADHVIFISEFSRRSYFELYGNPLKSYSVALNQVDPVEYFDYNRQYKDFDYVACCNSWTREEKRFDAILTLAKISNKQILLIGNKPDLELPSNIFCTGYIDSPVCINYWLNHAIAFVNFSYKDAAPKTVLQALCVGLPVFYASSGGVPELVEHYGVGIAENAYAKNTFENNIPELSESILKFSSKIFWNNYLENKKYLTKRDNTGKFTHMINEYFNQIKRISHE